MRVKNKVRPLLALTLSAGVMLSLAGCGDDTEALQKEIKTLRSQNNQLMQAQSDNAITENSIDSSLRQIEETGNFEFFKQEDKLIFPDALVIPDSSVGVSDSNVRVGASYNFSPSDNWLVKIKGSTVDFSHPANVWGSIKSVSVDETVAPDMYKPIIQKYFSRFPKTTITYRSLFIEEYELGVLASAKLVVDKKDHVVNVGFITRGEAGVLFMFDFEDNKTGIQQELVDSLIGSGMLGDSKIKID